MRHLLIAAAALSVAVPTGRAEAAGCSYASTAERNWVVAVEAHSTLNCHNARWVYRKRPAQRDEYPGNHRWKSWATKLPSPAALGTSWCTVTTIEKYRAPIIPFGDHVLFSLRLTRTYSYNGSTVGVGAAFIDADITENALGRWHFDGIVASNDGYVLPSSRYQHRTDKFGRFSTDGIPPLNIAAVSSVLHNKIWFQANGDWATMNEEGKPGCQNS